MDGRWIILAKIVGGIAAVASIAGLTLWATRGSNAKPQTPISEQWMQAVAQFGLEPVYPPQEDFLVGDVLAVIADDATHDISRSPLPARALKLSHLDMTRELEETYSATYQFPASIARPAEPNGIWAPNASDGPIFKLSQTPRTTLPIAMLPSFSVKTNRLSDLGGVAGDLVLGVRSEGVGAVELKVDGVETYGIPAVPAQAALTRFCTDKKTKVFCTQGGLRGVLSNLVGQKIFDTVDIGWGADRKTIMRYSVELALVSRAYLVRSVETTIETSTSIGLTGRRGAADAPPRDTPADEATRKAASATADIRDAIKSSIPLTKTFARPVVIGFRSVRWNPAP